MGSPGLEDRMLRIIPWEVLLRVLDGPQNFRDFILESDCHAIDMVGTKEGGFQNEMCLATTALVV